MESPEGQTEAAGSRGAAGDARDRRVAPRGGRGWLIVALVVALYAAARVWRLDASCLWFDEIFGAHAARQGWGDLLRFVALDLIHPPLFYVLLKIWVAAGGESVWWLRLLPVAASGLALVPVALLGRELRLGRRAVALALVLAASSGYLVKYAQEVRMYAPLLLFAACSLWLFARLCDAGAEGGRRRRAMLALALVNLLLVYTHYFGWLLVGLELVFLLAWRRKLAPGFAAWAAADALLFAPWAWAVWRAASAGGVAQNIGWAARPRPHELFLPYLLLHEPFRFQQHSHEPAVLRLSVALALMVFAPPLLALAWRAFARGGRAEKDGARGGREEKEDARARPVAGGVVGGGRDNVAGRGDSATRAGSESHATRVGAESRENFAVRFLVFFSVAPVVLTFLLAHALPHSVWGTRHLIVIAPAYLLLAAHAVASLRPGWLAACVCALLGCWLALAAALFVTRRHVPPVWCAWGTLARAAEREDDESAARRGDDAARRDDDAARRDEPAPARERNKVYAFEDLVAYHLWHERGGGARASEVSVVRNAPGAIEDRAFFLPRGFDEVSAVEYGAAFGEERFWLAFRGAAWDEAHPALRPLAARGYKFERRHEVRSHGQTAFMVLAVRR